MSDPRWRWSLVAGALVLAAHFAMPSGAANDVVYLVIGGAAAALLLLAAARRGLARPAAWWWLATGVSLVLAGDLTWTVYDALGIEPFPSHADVLYLAGYPCLAYALWLLGRRDRRDVSSLLDALIIAVSAGVLAWIYLLAPYVEDPTLTTLERAVSLAYPVGDLILVPMLVRLVLAHGARHRAHLLLLVGMLAYFAADVGFVLGTIDGSYATGGVLDSTWLLAYVLFASAAWHPSAQRELPDPTTATTLSSRRLAALATASVLAPAMLLVDDQPDSSTTRVAAGASIVLFLLVLQRMAGLIRQVRQQADELATLSRTDPLTGAANRRALDDLLAAAVAFGDRHGEGPAVAMLDLDHFKDYNDRFGHPAGDRFLHTTVRAWRRELREFDLLARYGGEEFVVVLPRVSLDEAGEVVDRLRAAVPEGRTCSAGVVLWEPGMDVGDLIDAADRAVYAAKRQGRDRTVLAVEAVAGG